MNGPVEIRFVDQDQRDDHEGEHGHQTGTDQQHPCGPQTGALGRQWASNGRQPTPGRKFKRSFPKKKKTQHDYINQSSI